MLITLPDGWEELAGLRRPQSNARRREWYRIEAKADETAEVYVYDEIGAWGLTAKQFVADLGKIKAKNINLHLNTPGGDVFDGIAIHNALRAHSASVNVTVDGLAASIGSVIAMAGDTITMAKHSTMMIHDPYGGCLGNCDDMMQMGMVLDKLGGTIAEVYAERTKKLPMTPKKMPPTPEDWRKMMKAETWMSASEAVALGLADDIEGDEAGSSKAAFDLSIYANVPADLLVGIEALDKQSTPTKRELERVLRDAGLTRHEAKSLLATYQGSDNDGDTRDANEAELERLLDGLKILNF